MILKGCERFLDVDELVKSAYVSSTLGYPTVGVIINDRYSDEIENILKKYLNDRSAVVILYDPFILRLKNNRFLYSVLKEKSCKIINHAEQEIALIKFGMNWELNVVVVIERDVYDMLVKSNDPVLPYIKFEQAP